MKKLDQEYMYTTAPMGKEEDEGEGCTCHKCGRKYKVDIIVPDEIWEKIKPAGKARGAGLLCGPCIAEKLETLDRFVAYHLINSEEAT